MSPIAFPYHVDRTGRTATVESVDRHARELIEQVLLTAPGERVMRPTFGTGVHQLVFAPASDQAATAAQHLVSGALQQWLSGWVEVLEVDVTSEDAALTVTVRYQVRSTGQLGSTTVQLGG